MDTTTDIDQARSALREIVDLLIEQKPQVLAQFGSTLAVSEHGKEWLDYALEQQAGQLDAVVVDAAVKRLPASQRTAAEEFVRELFERAPVLTLVPADLLCDWMLDALK